jgi:translation initiation factor IF-3
LGILPLEEAIELAKEKGLDVVEVSPNTEPPVCKILDHGKHLFEQKKKNQGAKKKQKNNSS